MKRSGILMAMVFAGLGLKAQNPVIKKLRGGKYCAFEAGTRVPFLFSWPQAIRPGVSSALLSQADLLTSFSC
ncbi:hypothetical protein V9K67_00175 [Paraflavisolibacter sp. H34]|uniref:hypothetical protein n=1 Tax=Huijunlia imazamoxiresistens TaxID=3127457 RepID=UPI0030186845